MSRMGESSKISKIHIATDGSAHAESAVEYGASLAALLGASVTVIYVIDARQLAGHFLKHFSEVIGGGTLQSGLTGVRGYYRAHGLDGPQRGTEVGEKVGVGCLE